MAELIRNLHRLGYHHGVLDDMFGPGTETTVMAFLALNGLDTDGRVRAVTLAPIREHWLMRQPRNRPWS